MRHYESVVVFDPVLNEEELKKEIGRIQAILETGGAKEIAVDNWGRKEIAYMVRKKRNGCFVCYKYGSEDLALVNNFTGLLRIQDSVIKFQTHKISDRKRKFKGRPRKSVELGGSWGGDDFLDDVDAY